MSVVYVSPFSEIRTVPAGTEYPFKPVNIIVPDALLGALRFKPFNEAQ